MLYLIIVMEYIKYRRLSTAEMGDDRLTASGPDRRRLGGAPVLNTTIMLFLLQDGITNGAIYALLGLALVLVFAVTRVILIPQGEFVTYGALSYAVLATGKVPGTAWLAMAMGVAALALDLFEARRSLRLARVARSFALNIVLPAAILALAYALAGPKTPIAINIALSLLIVAAIGLFLYRVAFQPLAHTSVLVLLIASVGAHLALQGLGLVFFGAEGQRGPTISDTAFTVGALRFTGQSLAVYGLTIAFIIALWLFFVIEALSVLIQVFSFQA